MIDIIIRLIIDAVQESRKRQREELQRAAAASRKAAAAARSTSRPASTSRTTGAKGPAPDPNLARLEVIERMARAESVRCASEGANERFASLLDGEVADAAKAAVIRLRKGDAGATAHALREIPRLEWMLEIASEMARQRRDPDQLLLLGDADALADACYQPVVDFARGHGIKLTSERAATFVGEKDLAIFLGFIPTGLAPIVLPSAWAIEVAWWPALAHEIGHDFLASVRGLDGELRTRFSLPPPGGSLPEDGGLFSRDLAAVFGTWLDEIFADLFGTLMLGPAFIETMMWSFGNPENPEQTMAVAPGEGWRGFDEHPPGHFRVVVGCRLLAEIGFARESDQLEKRWRAQHGKPDRFFFPTRTGNWISLNEEPVLERATTMVCAMYEEGFPAMAGIGLRSIPGLDLGPREHRTALDAKNAFLAGHSTTTSDPRCLIAGAVLAWREQPKLAPRILKAARANIAAVGVTRRRLRKRSSDAGAAGSDRGPTGMIGALTGLDGSDAELARDALLVGEILGTPRALQRGGRTRAP